MNIDFEYQAFKTKEHSDSDHKTSIFIPNKLLFCIEDLKNQPSEIKYGEVYFYDINSKKVELYTNSEYYYISYLLFDTIEDYQKTILAIMDLIKLTIGNLTTIQIKEFNVVEINLKF